ncbi:MAG: pseudouridine synthase [Planctomycetota bacterium]|jgi:tRNA pseudouridine65 synthase
MGGPLPILHHDARCVAIDKPPGMLVHRTKESVDRVFVLQTLRDQIGRHVYPVHRLDRPASGAMVFGLDPESARLLQESLREGLKEYFVLVRGETPERFVSDRELTSDKGKKQSAHTEFERVETVRGFSLLKARLSTGRRHQIRRHLAHLGHQVVGDTQHGKGRINAWLREEFGLPRLFLHSQRLVCSMVDVTAPLAGDLERFWERFRCS